MKSIFFLLVALCGLTLSARAQDVAFIAHPGVTESALGTDDVKSILLGNKTRWESGNVKLAVLTEGALHEKVIQTYTQRSADQFDKFWKKQVFTGKGTAPAAFKTEAELIDYVSKNPGAFGYVSKGAALNGVKELGLK